MAHKIIAFDHSKLNSILHYLDMLNCFPIKVFQSINQAIKEMEFNPITGEPKEIYFISEKKIWIFAQHGLFYPLLRFSQHAGLLHNSSFHLINWDEHSDFYYPNDKTLSARYGLGESFLDEPSAYIFINKVLEHFKMNVGLTSFLYPFIWSKELTTYIWRSKPDIRSGQTGVKRLPWGIDPSSHRYHFESIKDEKMRNIDKLIYFIINQSEALQQLEFRNPLSMIGSADLDFFFKNRGKLRRSDRLLQCFQTDLHILKKKSISPEMYFIATSPGFVFGPEVAGLIRELLPIINEGSGFSSLPRSIK